MAKNPPKAGSTGSGPNTFMDLLDQPQKTLDGAKSMLGIQDSCPPNSFYKPATANSDGSINQGTCSAFDPSSGPSVPISQ